MDEFNFKKSNKKGLFISFEGGEGSGKSTQIKLISKSLNKDNLSYVLTREPGGTPASEEIRRILVSGEVEKLDSYSELLCFTAARRQHLKEIIIPALDSGQIVICDRYIDSTLVYQGFVGGVCTNKINQLHNDFCYNLYPDLTILLDIDPKIGLKRKKFSNLNEDRFENQNYQFHDNVRKKYIELSNLYKDRFITVDANLDEFKIFNMIKNRISNFFS